MATHGLPAWPWAGTAAEDLPPAERLLLDGLRLWAAAARTGRTPLATIRLPLVAEDAGEAAVPLDRLLHALSAEALPTDSCPLCPQVSPREATLLLGCALAQRGARREALALLLRHWPAGAAYAAMPPAIHLGIALSGAGLLLRNPLRCRGRGR